MPGASWGLRGKMSIYIQKLSVPTGHMGTIWLLFSGIMAGEGLLPLPIGCAGDHAWKKSTPKTRQQPGAPLLNPAVGAFPRHLC